MGKKVLGIVGSPRKNGNTDDLIDVILESAGSEGAGTEKIYLKDLQIENCQECLHCHEVDPKICAIKDDMEGLVRKMNAADVWVLGTPIFWWGPSGIFKTFVDRWYGYDIDFKTKKIIFAYASGDPDEQVARYFRGMMEEALGYEGTEAFAFVHAGGASDKGDLKKLDRVVECAKKIGADCLK